jgi:hypothetical protein
LAVVFFSYSHKDEDLRDRLETHLAMLKHQGAIETWHDRRIAAGDDLDRRIDQELERADVILLLVSPDFLASSYCYGVEVKRAMERHEAGSARVIPVVLRHCDWHPAPFGKLLAAPKDGKPIQSWTDLDEAFLDVTRAIRAALPRSPQHVAPSSLPVPLAPDVGVGRPRSSNLRLKKNFTEADRERFLEEAFSFMAQFFEGSLDELAKRNNRIETRFRRIDANHFTAVIYRDGDAVSRGKVTLGGMFGRGISYSNRDGAHDNSSNENMTVESDNQGLHLKPLGIPHFDTKPGEQHLTFEGAAEYYWSLLIERLQR